MCKVRDNQVLTTFEREKQRDYNMQPPWEYNRCLRVKDPPPRKRRTDTVNPTEQSKMTLTRAEQRYLEKMKAHSSEPWSRPTLNDIQMRDLQTVSKSMPWNKAQTKPDMKAMQTLTECLQLISELAEEVKDIGQLRLGKKATLPVEGAAQSTSLDQSRSLILQWAQELDRVMMKKRSRPTDEKMGGKKDLKGQGEEGEKERNLDKENERLQQWAIELKNVKEANGLSDEDLKRLLCPGGRREPRLAGVLPLLEFVAWTLLSTDHEEDMFHLWLPAKQKAWRTRGGSPRYIPNSVWQWIQSASGFAISAWTCFPVSPSYSVAVCVHLDPETNHPWLNISANKLQVQEAQNSMSQGGQSPRRFDSWPCVLGDITISTGRHYWEVDVSCRGTWRLGVTSISAPRKQKFPIAPKAGYWTLWRASQSLWACTDNPTKLPGAAVPSRVGVYVNMEEGQVSFYDVENRVHIYSFSDFEFQESLVPVFICSDPDSVLRIVPLET